MKRISKREIRTKMAKLGEAVDLEIADNAASGSMYARGLANEGYAGGYRQALDDVLHVMAGIHPNSRYSRAIEEGE